MCDREERAVKKVFTLISPISDPNTNHFLSPEALGIYCDWEALKAHFQVNPSLDHHQASLSLSRGIHGSNEPRVPVIFR